MFSSRNVVTMMVCVFLVSIFAMPAKADFSSLNNSVSLPGFNTGYSTSSNDGKVQFNTYMSNNDLITSASIYITKDTNSDMGWVSAYINGQVTPSVPHEYQSNNLSINRRSLELQSGVGMGSSPEIVGWNPDGYPIYGSGYVSNANAYLEIAGVTPLYANSTYDEYWSGGDKGFGDEDPKLYFSQSTQWRILFDDLAVGKGIEMGTFGSALTASNFSVPEPASLGVLSLGILTLIARRRRKV